ncbi:MAG: hypothetical protein IKJ83_04960 [Ruminococcus sp.]|nr:hypothetical protein [Ruminococcus sp.]
MKRMVYIVIAVTSLIAAGVIFAGCMGSPAPKNENQLTGLSLSQNHMNFGYCYSFYLREEGEKVLFDAEVRFDEEPYCIILESCEVDKAHMNKLRGLDEKYSITDYVTTHKSNPLLFAADDKTVNKTTVYLSDGTDKSADTKAEHIDVLYDFFFDLAKKYINESVYLYEE